MLGRSCAQRPRLIAVSALIVQANKNNNNDDNNSNDNDDDNNEEDDNDDDNDEENEFIDIDIFNFDVLVDL